MKHVLRFIAGLGLVLILIGLLILANRYHIVSVVVVIGIAAAGAYCAGGILLSGRTWRGRKL